MVPPQEGSPRLGQKGGFPDEGPPAGGVVLGEQVLHTGFHVPGIGHIGLGVREGQLDGLDDFMVGVRPLPLRGQVQALEDVQSHQDGDAVAVGGNLADGIALVVHGDGLHPHGAVGGKVLL